MRCGASPRSRSILGQVHWVLFVEEAFRGNEDDYYDPRNSYLSDVLDRKLGIPISLSVLYADVAARLGLELAGVNLPGHFVLRVVGDSPLFIDAYNEGAVLDRAGCERLVEGVVGHPVALTDEQIEPVGSALVVADCPRTSRRTTSAVTTIRRPSPSHDASPRWRPTTSTSRRNWGLLAYRTGHPGESLAPLSPLCGRAVESAGHRRHGRGRPRSAAR